MGKRELTVYSMSVYNRKAAPLIRLQGRWLDALGFKIGNKVVIEEKQGELVLKLVEEPGNQKALAGLSLRRRNSRT